MRIRIVPSFDLIFRSRVVVAYDPTTVSVLYAERLYHWLCFVVAVDVTEQVVEELDKLKRSLGK